MANKVVNIVIAGIGGQGVLKSTDILSETLFRAGYDVKKSEIHGMAQRGGSVCSDVRYGEKVYSPMAPVGETDYLVVLSEDQVEAHAHKLRESGVLIAPQEVEADALENKKSLNVALLGVLSAHLDVPEKHWLEALDHCLPEKIREVNQQAFDLGRGKI